MRTEERKKQIHSAKAVSDTEAKAVSAEAVRDTEVFLCVDVGGTKTAVGCFTREGKELFSCAFPTEPERGCADLAARAHSRVLGLGVSFVSACIASPGPLDAAAGKILHIATMGWRDVPICEIFGAEFGLSFRLLNDCTAGALGEWTFGQKKSVSDMVYISVSTGVGGGLIVNNALCFGRGNSGEIGHLRVRGEGLSCACGQTDCLELYASGTGIETGFRRRTGRSLSCSEIAKLTRGGDSDAKAVFSRCAEALAEGIGHIVKIVDPERIVFGGGVTAAADLFLPEVKRLCPSVEIVLSRLDGKQVLFGCLAYQIL